MDIIRELEAEQAAKIAAWRRAEAERLTRERRPDLLTPNPGKDRTD